MSGKGKNKKKGIVKNHGKRVLELKGTMEEYGKVSKALGDKRVLVVLVDGKEVVAHIPGKFTKKKIWVNIDNVVLVSKREYENNKMDIIHLYEYDEVKKLVKLGEIPETFLHSGTSQIVSENLQEEEGFDIEENSEEENKPKVVENKKDVYFEEKIDTFDFDDI